MELHENPLLQPEDFRAGYRESIEELKNHPEALSFEKLCYDLFQTNELGRKFMEVVTERYLIPSMVERNAANYQLIVIWADGFKDFARMLKQLVMTHDQRIKAGDKK